MATKKCIHVVATPDYQPEMCSLTIPNLKAYADKIKADFNLIQDRAKPSWPVVCEKQRIYEIGRSYDWNFSIDADILIHPSTADITLRHPPTKVGNWWYYDIAKAFDISQDKYFRRDGRHYGIVESFVVTTRHTHDLWEPLPGAFEDYAPMFEGANYWRTGEYCLSRNMAKYGLEIMGIFDEGDDFFHVNTTSKEVQRPEEIAFATLRNWGLM
jgi:hypothetical protein